jgi:hypothetical protein
MYRNSKFNFLSSAVQSPNRITTIWNIVNDLTGKNKAQNDIHTIKVEDCN